MRSLNGGLRVSLSRDWFNWMRLETRAILWYLWILNSKVVCIWTKMISGHPSQISFLGFFGQPPGKRNSVWKTHIHTTISVFGVFGYQSLIKKHFPSRSNTFIKWLTKPCDQYNHAILDLFVWVCLGVRFLLVTFITDVLIVCLRVFRFWVCSLWSRLEIRCCFVYPSSTPMW